MADDGTGYGQYCPIARAVDILGERWSLLVVRDLLLGVTRFNDLARGLPGLSRSLLTKRLRQLERAGILDHVGDQYLLTEAGKELRSVVFGMGEWASRWTFGDPHPSELDPTLLVWWMHTRLDASVLPDRRCVLSIRFSDDRQRFWLVLEGGTASVCLVDPGFEVDVTIASDLQTLYLVWLGRLPVADAVRDDRITFEGPRALTRVMPQVLLLSPAAELVIGAS